MAEWTFLTNHTQVLLCVATDPGMRVRDIADCVGITERAVHRIVSDLVDAGYLIRRRVGRRNEYEIDRDLPLRHPAEGPHNIGRLLSELLAERQGA